MNAPALDFEAILAASPMCAECSTVAVERHREVCEGCTRKRTTAVRAEGLRAAWTTVPVAFQRWGLDLCAAACTKARAALAAGASPEEAWDGVFVRDADAIARARVAATVRRPLVTLVGPTRAGKSTLAACLMREWMIPGAKLDAASRDVAFARRVRWVHATELVAEALDRPRGSRGQARPLLDAAHDASVLVLDELLDDHESVIFRLLHERHRDLLPTIVTTGLTREAVGENFGGAVEGRLFEDAYVINVRRTA